MSFVYGAMEISFPKMKYLCMVLFVLTLLSGGCGAINIGKWRGIEHADPDEAYYLVNDVFLTATSAMNPREVFDHNLNEAVHLYFTARDEKPTYVVKSVWQDPDGQEYRTIRTTYDKAREEKKGDQRSRKSTPRIHSMPLQELYAHKPGMWKVSLYIEDQLARRLTFLVK